LSQLDLFHEPDPRCPKCGHTEAVHAAGETSYGDHRPNEPIWMCWAQDLGALHGCRCTRPRDGPINTREIDDGEEGLTDNPGL